MWDSFYSFLLLLLQQLSLLCLALVVVQTLTVIAIDAALVTGLCTTHCTYIYHAIDTLLNYTILIHIHICFRSRGSSGGVYIDLGSIFDLMYYSSGHRRNPNFDGRNPNKLSFLETFFSFIFGDGDPNEGEQSLCM